MMSGSRKDPSLDSAAGARPLHANGPNALSVQLIGEFFDRSERGFFGFGHHRRRVRCRTFGRKAVNQPSRFAIGSDGRGLQNRTTVVCLQQADGIAHGPPYQPTRTMCVAELAQ
jgi:hypothetical protein